MSVVRTVDDVGAGLVETFLMEAAEVLEANVIEVVKWLREWSMRKLGK